MSIKWNNGNTEKTFGFKLEKITAEENRFHAIYFIDSVTGSVLISNKYTDFSNTSEDLISGFLSAMNMFMREIKGGDEEIQEINFHDTRILYERRGRLMCIGFTRKTNLQIERGILNEIMNEFYDRFKKEINNFNGYIKPSIVAYKNRLETLNLNSLYKLKINI